MSAHDIADHERWLREMCEDYRLASDDHTIARRLAINGMIHDLRTELAALRRDRERLLNVARGCTDYAGGHSGEMYEAFQHGIATVVRALEAAAKNDPNDTQVNALERIGHAAIAQEGRT